MMAALGATAAASPMATASAVGTAGSGLFSAYSQNQAGKAQASASRYRAEEVQRQIKQTKAQAMDEENRRRSEHQYLSSRNRAAAAASGFEGRSANFANLDRANADKAGRDVGIIRANAASAIGQKARQKHQHRVAGYAAKRQGNIGAIGTLFNTGTSMVQGMPGFYSNRPKIGVRGGG